MKHLIFALGLVFLAACGNGTREAPRGLVDLGGTQFRVVNGSCVRDAMNMLSGTCGVISPADLGGVSAGKSFALRFRLIDGGAVTLHAYSTNLQGGVDLRFSRTGNTLKFRGTIGGQSVDHSHRFTNFNAAEEISLQIDVHNNESPSHVIIWGPSAAPGFNVNDKLVDTAKCGLGNNPNDDCSTEWDIASGTGSGLGISLESASLISVTVSPPKYVE
jgi:hypothetical protein